MTTTVLGVFTDKINAEEAISVLRAEGYNPKDISIIMKDMSEGKEVAKDTGAGVAQGAVSGVTTGALLGGLAGILASVAIPGLGAFFIGGPIAAALGLTGAAATTVAGATTGAVAGGILGSLMGLGLTKDQATVYEQQVNQGAILLAVPARVGEERWVEETLADNGANDITSVVNREQSATEDRTDARVRVKDQSGPRVAFADEHVNRTSRSRVGVRHAS